MRKGGKCKFFENQGGIATMETASLGTTLGRRRSIPTTMAVHSLRESAGGIVIILVRDSAAASFTTTSRTSMTMCVVYSLFKKKNDFIVSAGFRSEARRYRKR